ncbi:MAG: DUF4389 domain-containing protein [Candidatus Micrarchaeia archaeon]|jgi:uncharacterized BrkB/YihY/UPF0761 family membrane protein
MKTVEYGVKFEKKASRLELLIRLVWMIPCILVLVFVAILGTIGYALQVLHILILGSRNKTFNDWMLLYYRYLIRMQAYLSTLTDEKCPILPDSK